MSIALPDSPVNTPPPAATQAAPSLLAADLFCGAGGLSEGLKQACSQLERPLDLVAVNHWTVAIDTHSENHPDARHFCTSVEGVNPLHVVPGGVLEFLCAGVECTFHSNARGGGRLNEQSRSSAWDLLRWADKLTIHNILIENVPEFVKWGPLYEDCDCGAGGAAETHLRSCHLQRPIPARAGEYFRNFVRNLKVMGYAVDWRILRAADYGDPTTRKRFFLQAKKKRPGRRVGITWPEPSHYPRQSLPLTGSGAIWKPAREIIDWTLLGHSIYLSPQEARKVGVKRPLAPNTLRRIYAGLHKFCGIPFVVGAGGPQGSGHPHSVEEPLGTLLAENHRAVVTPTLTPYLVVLRNHADAQSLSDPAPTVCAEGQHLGLAQPYIVINRSHNTPSSVDDPLRTLTPGGQMGLAHPFLIQCEHSTEGHARRCQCLSNPLPTVTANASFALIHPFVLGQQSGTTARSVDQPLPTVATAGAISLITPTPHAFLTKYHGSHAGKEDGVNRVLSLDDTLPTVDCSNRLSLVHPFLTSYYGNGQAHDLHDPLPTIMTHDKFGLVESRLRDAGVLHDGDQLYWLDILFRMLQPHELAGAHSYPRAYRFSGSKDDQVAQIGNSVPIRMATALCLEMLRPPVRSQRSTRRTQSQQSHSGDAQ